MIMDQGRAEINKIYMYIKCQHNNPIKFNVIRQNFLCRPLQNDKALNEFLFFFFIFSLEKGKASI